MQALLDSIKHRLDKAIPMYVISLNLVHLLKYYRSEWMSMRTNLLFWDKSNVRYFLTLDLPITEEIYISALEAKSAEWAKVFYNYI